MSTFVLVHGAWHGAWCWYKVVALLEKAGHTVIAPDLSSQGIDRTPISQVSLDMWTQQICQILNDHLTPSILIGHSRAGAIISQAAEQCPEKVQALAYVAAILLRDGESLRQTEDWDKTSLVSPNIIFSEDISSMTIAKEKMREVFYEECPAEDVVLAQLLMTPEATLPWVTEIHITENNFGRIPRVYIQCLRDKAVPPALQKKMYTALPCEKVLSIDTDHSPFFSKPEELVAHLLSI
ncbi:MAG: alpha/beta fold hydrolase [Desulfobacula sp.]|nr:alpha/beta fold hydrolase [Desulfobacula sp.]